MNTFGPSASQQYPLYDPRSVRENRPRFRRDVIPLLSRANSMYITAGLYPARGWILLARSDYNKISSYSTDLQLNVGNPMKLDNVATLKNLSIVQAQCVTHGLESSPNALYLVELTDARGILCNEWFKFPLTASYNIRAPAYPEVFHPSSMNGGTTWTWTTMLQNIWTQMGTFLGTWPGLPYAPAGTPEGFWFPGVSAWTALCQILDYLGMAVACDLTKTSPYTIVSVGASDTGFTELQDKYITNLEDDLAWIDTGAGRVPRTVKVLFRRRNAIYGTEETVTYRNDTMAQQWDMNPYYTVSVTAPALFASAVGTHFIWSDFTVRYDHDSNPVAADVAMANTIAQERVTQYFDQTYSRTSGYMSRTYAGALPFTTGSQVDGVAWLQDYSNQSRHGWKTRIVRGSNSLLAGMLG